MKFLLLLFFIRTALCKSGMEHCYCNLSFCCKTNGNSHSYLALGLGFVSSDSIIKGCVNDINALFPELRANSYTHAHGMVMGRKVEWAWPWLLAGYIVYIYINIIIYRYRNYAYAMPMTIYTTTPYH